MWDIVVAGGIIVTAITVIPVFWQLRQHPRGLHILFFAEMWERFSYYGMRGILIFYMTQHFLFNDERAQGQYGAYTSLVYLMPLIGGFLADKYLGNRKAIAFGALLLVGGHFMMAVEQAPAVQTLTYQGETYQFDAEGRQNQRQTWLVVDGQRYEYGPAEGGGIAITGLPAGASLPSVLPAGSYEMGIENAAQSFFGTGISYVDIFYLALALIIMGVGFLKANISSIVGQLYTQDDPRRDSGFTLYYFGINLGAFWASILCAGLGATYGWWAGFGLAGIGMLFGFLVFTRRRLLFFLPGPAQLPDHVGQPPNPELLRKGFIGPINREWLIYLLGFGGVALAWWLVQREPVVNWSLLGAAILVILYFIVYMIRRCTAVEAQRIILALILIAAATVFWTLFELAGTALNQFAERNTQLPNDGFFSVTAGQTQSFNAGFILIFAPIFAAIWAFLEKRKADPNDAAKFALGLIQVGAGFLVLVWGAQFADANYRVPLLFLVLLYLLHTTGELCLSPVGLSAMTKLAPAAIVSTVMATWFLSSSAAQALGAQIAKLTAAETVGGQVLDPAAALATYVQVFQQIGWGAIIIGVTLGVASIWLRKLAHKGVVVTPKPEADAKGVAAEA
ncbi:MAG: peptide MFS transporter [Hyphomonadaceae bacterium]